MKLVIGEYENFLDYSSLTSEKILSIIENYSLSFSQVRNQMVEWNIHFPMFIKPFYNYVYHYQSIPNQLDYLNYYLTTNEQYFVEADLDHQTMLGLAARLYRTYPSLVRDIHFSTLLKERLHGVVVFYNTQLDIHNDIDTLIIANNQFYSLSLFTDTANGRKARAKKVHRHTRFSNVIYIELPVSFKGSSQCGDFFLYGNRELNLVTQQLLLT